MDAGIVSLFIPIFAILGGFAVAIASILSKSKIRQLQIRERIAMIEKGLIPPPEVDPGGFDRAVPGQLDRIRRSGSGRHRRAGIVLMGVGFGLMLLIGFVADRRPGRAIGVGGFLAVLGLAFLINSVFESREYTRTGPPAVPAPPTSAAPPAFPDPTTSSSPETHLQDPH
jgi:hypothetical protein